MSQSWLDFLKHNPLSILTSINNPSLNYFVRRDLLNENPGNIEQLWNLPYAQKILNKQLINGAWPDKQKAKHEGQITNYLLLETYRNLGVLVEIFGFNKFHSSIQRAAEYIFSTQTKEGDFRGIYGTQYSPNYSGGLLELLVKAGFHEDPEIKKCFQWFISNVQIEGGWTLPLLTHGYKIYEMDPIFRNQHLLPFQPEKPFSHFITGIVIRAFAAHPLYRKNLIALRAGELLISRFFKPDEYSARKAPKQWESYSFPFWWHDLISVLDSLALMGFSKDNPRIRFALNHYQSIQKLNGLWDLYILKSKSLPDLKYWIIFILCRILMRFFLLKN